MEILANLVGLYFIFVLVCLGMGRLPCATSKHLKGHKNLGVHTDMLSSEVMYLWEAGCISNCFKNVRRGRIVASFAVGGKEMFDFIHENSSVSKFKNRFHLNNDFFRNYLMKRLLIYSITDYLVDWWNLF